MNHTLLNNQERARQLRIRVENITILLLACPFPFSLFLLTFFPFSRISKAMQGSFEMGRMFSVPFPLFFSYCPCSYGRENGTHGRSPWGSLSSIFCADSSEWDIRCTMGSWSSIFFLFILFFRDVKRFLLPGWTRKQETDSDPDAPRHRGRPCKCRHYLALYAHRCRRRRFRLFYRQFHTGNRYDLRDGKSPCIHG